MIFDTHSILEVLDAAADVYNFPMLDNLYVKLAAARMSLYRSDTDWGLVIEIFGSSCKSRLPDTDIYTFASTLVNRDKPEDYVTLAAYQAYLTANPHNESRFIYPIQEGDWLNLQAQQVAPEATFIPLRDQLVPVPGPDDYLQNGIILATEQPAVFELCRCLAAQYRDHVLASDQERRTSLPPNLDLILQLDEWHHPDLADDQLPADTETFQQIAQVLATGDVDFYKPTETANTHWKNWDYL